MKRNLSKQKTFAELAGEGDILDLGFVWHPNKFLKEINKCRSVTGVDIEEAEKPVNYDKVIQADLNEKFPLQDNSFDTIIAGDVIEHLYNPMGFLSECKRVLRKEGKLIISTPNRWIYSLWDDSPFHLKMWNYKQFKRLLGHYGFKVEKCLGSRIKAMPSISHIIIYVCRKER